jgi:hypothetical protein
MDSPRLGSPPEPMAVPMPTTMATYTAVMNAARAPYTTVLLMTRSMSYRRYLSTAMPMAMGMRTKERTARFWITANHVGSADLPVEAKDTAMANA